MRTKLPYPPPSIDFLLKSLYESFKRERAVFSTAFADQLPPSECEHYTSLLLHRLMFLYFLQQRGFLDGNSHYLSHKLRQFRTQSGSDHFYSRFLLRLFREGFNTPQRSTDFLALYGRIPYLGGNLFSTEALAHIAQLHIPDSAFTRIFSFFDSYTWQMEDEPPRAKNVINPTLLGAMAEQYVNQRQMGAYYTRRDVTQYIATFTLLPQLYDRLLQSFPGLNSSLRLLQQQPQRYIPTAVRSTVYLPGEVEREYTVRQAYYAHLHQYLQSGETITGDDFITYNLHIDQFLQDALQRTEDPLLLASLYEHLTHLTILDPTCGSGAFLFAALEILFPLYTLCLERAEMLFSTSMHPSTRAHESKTRNLRSAVAGLRKSAPAPAYFILHLILTRNLYGIDIMPEAVDLCRLRLSLRLLSSLQRIEEIRPLPALKGHICQGNTLETLYDSAAIGSSPQEGGTRFAWQNTFGEILNKSGFDVILGNPPYVEFSEESSPSFLHTFETARCRNLYPCIVERSRQLLATHGRFGMVLPLAAFATRNMQPFLTGFQRWFPSSWISFYHFRPSMLFSGGKVASIPTAIALGRTSGPVQRFSTTLLKWFHEQRTLLFSRLTYCRITVPADPANRHYYPKFGDALENAILRKILQHDTVERYLSKRPNENALFYRSAGGLYWKVFVNFPWPYATSSNKRCFFLEPYDRDIFVALYNSSLFWWYYTVTFDTFNLKDYMLFGFRFTYPTDPTILSELKMLSRELMLNFRTHAEHLKRGQADSYTIYARKAKPILDRIDTVLARHYNFTTAELDFILTYDVKFRVGSAAD